MPSNRNIAVWGYWKGVKRYQEGTAKANSAWFEARVTDETGWSWTTPLHDGTTSIGFVMHPTASNAKKAKVNSAGEKISLTEHYLQFVPGVRGFIGEKGEFIPGTTKSATDYIYFASRYSGSHFRIIGDAANFVDPLFSSGVHIAMTGGLSAALTICASIKGETTEELAQTWHDTKVGITHTRFLFVVLGAYQQMRMQSLPILRDVKSGDFDKAFEIFHPVIYGLADSSAKLTNSKVKIMMDVLQSYFDPNVDNEDIKVARMRYGPELVNPNGPSMGSDKIQELAKDDTIGQRVMRKVDALKVFRDDMEVLSMDRQALLGYIANVRIGELGLIKNPQ